MVQTALHKAAKRGDIQTVQLILLEQNDVHYINSGDRTNSTALHYAIRANHLEVASLLLTYGADPNAQDMHGLTPFHSAFWEGRLEFIKLLLKNGANPNLADNHGATPFLYAAHDCNFDIIKFLLLNGGANINAIDTTYSLTPFKEVYIMLMEGQKNKEVMELLVAEMVKLDHSDIKISESNLEGFNVNKQLISESELLKELEQQCHKEIEQMKSISVGENGLSFFDIFVLQKDINTLARCANNPDIVKYQNKFSMYSSFIEKSIGAGQARANLLQGGVESMDEIFESNQDAFQESQISWHHLPPEVRLMILENLSNNDLTKLQHTDAAEAKVGGTYAIYEGQ
ncbi:ankyrin repeat family protein [Orientia tsutsugamushi str. UT144]|uniref:Ankyrin repeat family protein n=1 Tax=Orientia tsutsugamushi str. UT144 TaxID=1441384 RepID=A0A0F3RM09_ORITS|nr:ankyrin repeat family protein [Orientia tsutsugamushi str. UT144]